MQKFAPYAKSIVAALIAGLGALGAALTDDHVTSSEWVAIASATLVALGVVFSVPNKDPQGEHQDESVQPNRILGKAVAGNLPPATEQPGGMRARTTTEEN